MNRPPELVVALVVLVAEYLAVLPGYTSAFVERISTHALTTAIAIAFFGFVIIRPTLLYLLWRGKSWVRTWIIWALPIAVLLVFLRILASSYVGSLSSTPQDIFSAYESLRHGNLVTTIALFVGLLAFLTFYSPRVSRWYRYMKESGRKSKSVSS